MSEVRAGGPRAHDITVVLATSRRARLLADTLRSFAEMSTDGIRWDVIVVDNRAGVADAAPEPETKSVVDAAAARLPIRLLTEPVPGKNRAINRALPHVAGDLVVFTDDDVVVERTWLSELWEGAARWPDASIFGGRVLPRWPEGRGPSADHPFFEHAYAIADFKHAEGPYSSGYVYGPNMAIRRVVFDAGWQFNIGIGPDGTDRYASGSETSLTVALEKAGHRAVYLPRVLVHHQVRQEQLTEEWLFGRAFRLGRARARQHRLSSATREARRDLLLTARRERASWQRCRTSGDQQAALDHALAYWMARGKLCECRMTRNRPEPFEAAAPTAPPVT